MGKPVTVVPRLSEELLQEEERLGLMKVPLKNGGGWMELAKVRLAQSELNLLLSEDPDLIKTLQGVIEGRGGEVSQERRQALTHALKEEGMLEKSGNVPIYLRAVLSAGYRETADGRPFIEEPIDLADTKINAMVERYEEFDQDRRARDERVRPFFLAKIKAMAKKKRDQDEGPSR